MPPDPHRPFCLGVFLSLATELVCVCVCVRVRVRVRVFMCG